MWSKIPSLSFNSVNIPSPVDLFWKRWRYKEKACFYLKHTPVDINKQKRKEKHLTETTFYLKVQEWARHVTLWGLLWMANKRPHLPFNQIEVRLNGNDSSFSSSILCSWCLPVVWGQNGVGVDGQAGSGMGRCMDAWVGSLGDVLGRYNTKPGPSQWPGPSSPIHVLLQPPPPQSR